MSVDRQPLHCRWSEVAFDESVEAEITIPGRRTSFVKVSACVCEVGQRLIDDELGMQVKPEAIKTDSEFAELNHVHAAPEDSLHFRYVALGRRRVVGADLLLKRMKSLPRSL